MNAKKTIGNGVNGVTVHFTISDLVNLNQMVHEIMTNSEGIDKHSQTPAEALALIVYKITSGGLDLEQSSKNMHDKEFDIFKVSEEPVSDDISTEDKRKEMIEVLIDLGATVPPMEVVKNEDKESLITE